MGLFGRIQDAHSGHEGIRCREMRRTRSFSPRVSYNECRWSSQGERCPLSRRTAFSSNSGRWRPNDCPEPLDISGCPGRSRNWSRTGPTARDDDRRDGCRMNPFPASHPPYQGLAWRRARPALKKRNGLTCREFGHLIRIRSNERLPWHHETLSRGARPPSA